MEYKVLGDFINLVDLRNRELGITNLLGVSIEKRFIPSIANIVGTDLSNYKVVKNGQFAYGPVTSRNGEKISIALLNGEDCIISSSYTVFEVTRKEELDPEYLMLWFSRPEFDRYARYRSHGSVREIFGWDEMCAVELPVPNIEKQRKIVKAYKTITDRIALKQRINDNLEALLLCKYHLLFDNDEEKTNCTIGDFGEIISGATPSTSINEYFCDEGIAWLTPKDLTATGKKFIYKGETDISQDAYDSCSTKLLPIGTVLLTSRAPVGTVGLAMSEVCTNQGFKSIVPNADIGSAFIYCFLKDNKSLLDSHASGTTFMEISGNVLKAVPAFIPSKKRLDEFNSYSHTIFQLQNNNEIEIDMLSSLQQTIISGISSR